MHTCNHESQRNPIHCIIPPYILEQIAENGTQEQREMAVRSLASTKTMMGQRQAVARGEVPPGGVSMAAITGKNRMVYSANFGTSLPGQIMRQEGQLPCGDPAVDEAYDGAGQTYDLFSSSYQRDSIDNNGMVLVSTVHYSDGYDNAFWNGSQMVYGDGDENLPLNERLFNRFTIAIDVIGHELTHGITQFEANLVYSNQSGALNESFSDVFGSLVKQSRLMQDARSADWIIGQGLFTPNVNGIGIRSMSAPGTAYNDPVIGKDPQPGHMSNYVNTTSDNGGVHINSGIPNRAFYIAAYELGGYAWEKAGKIWYVALTDRLNNYASFLDAANVTYTVAGELYGMNSLEQQAVKKGWSEVGLDVGGGTTDKPGCLPSLISVFRPNTSTRR